MTRPRAAKTCVRCGGAWRFGIKWPDGYVCRSCIGRAAKVRGGCSSCGAQRLLVGRDADGAAICVDCAGITTCFSCDTCGEEDRTWYSRTCVACSLRRRLARVLDDGTGEVARHLVPLYERVCQMSNPLAAMTWLNKKAVRERLASLASGATPLTHAGIDTMEGPQGREFLRELLVDVGLLPGRDKYLAAFVFWQERFLASVEQPAMRRELALYLAWRQQRTLVVRAEAGRLAAMTVDTARSQTSGGLRFLQFLSGRMKQLAELSQDDVDAFFAEASNPRIALDFLTFAQAHRRCPRVCLPQTRSLSSAGTPRADLRAIVGRLLEDEELDLADRVAGLFVVLLAQTVTRVAALRVDQVATLDGSTVLALGSDPVALPEPASELLRRYLRQRTRTTTTNTETEFLFPGGRPGEHVTAFQLTRRLNRLGITRLERQGALSHLVSQAPASVVAKATGYSLAATTARSQQIGHDWAHYAALISAVEQ